MQAYWKTSVPKWTPGLPSGARFCRKAEGYCRPAVVFGPATPIPHENVVLFEMPERSAQATCRNALSRWRAATSPGNPSRHIERVLRKMADTIQDVLQAFARGELVVVTDDD